MMGLFRKGERGIELKVIAGLVLTLLLIGMLTLAFNIQPAKASRTVYIRADGSVEGTTYISTVDNITYTFTDNIYDKLVVERDNIVVDGAGYTLQGTESEYGIDLTGRSNIAIKNMEIKAFGLGIWLSYSSNNTILGNNITANNWYGICLDSSTNNAISGNHIANNLYGIWLGSSTDNTISGNHIANNWVGIGLLYSSDNNAISGNNIANNLAGIGLNYSSNNNAILGNNITANNLYGVGLYESSNNTFYQNNFVNNTQQVCFWESGYANFWDDGDPSGGNYWSDHLCTGNPSDGSQPYIIDANNIDHYPFQDPNGWLLPPPDTTPPTVSIVSPENKTYRVADVPLTLTVSESTSWLGYSLDGQANITIAGNTTLTGLSDGMHTLIVYAKDIAGNTGVSGMVYFTIDTTPPTMSIVSPENKTYDTTDIQLTFTVDESVSWIAYSLDNEANVTITGNTTLSGLSDGSHSLIVYASDIAGNTGASEIIYFSIETIKAEPFPTLIVAAIVTIAMVGAALLVYYTKVKKTA